MKILFRGASIKRLPSSSPSSSSVQDEPSTLQLLKKHLVLEQTVEDYAETIGLLSQQCRQLLEMGHPDWLANKHTMQSIDFLNKLKDLLHQLKREKKRFDSIESIMTFWTNWRLCKDQLDRPEIFQSLFRSIE